MCDPVLPRTSACSPALRRFVPQRRVQQGRVREHLNGWRVALAEEPRSAATSEGEFVQMSVFFCGGGSSSATARSKT